VDLKELDYLGDSRIKIGISPAELQAAKLGVLEVPVPQTGGQSTVKGDSSFVSYEKNSVPRTAAWYHFVGGQLRGVVRTTAFGNDALQARDGVLEDVFRRLEKVMKLDGIEQTVRTNGRKGFIVAAQHWTDDEGVLSAYVVATNVEVTLVIFDPRFLDRKRFLPDLSLLDAMNKTGEKLASKLSAHPNSKRDVKVKDIVDALSVNGGAPLSRENASEASAKLLFDKPKVFKTDNYPSLSGRVARWDLLIWSVLAVGMLCGIVWFLRRWKWR
ncbi:MAG: hypothetical protein ACAI34_25515, partial [Verrucomicrobium sp.]